MSLYQSLILKQLHQTPAASALTLLSTLLATPSLSGSLMAWHYSAKSLFFKDTEDCCSQLEQKLAEGASSRFLKILQDFFGVFHHALNLPVNLAENFPLLTQHVLTPIANQPQIFPDMENTLDKLMDPAHPEICVVMANQLAVLQNFSLQQGEIIRKNLWLWLSDSNEAIKRAARNVLRTIEPPIEQHHAWGKDLIAQTLLHHNDAKTQVAICKTLQKMSLNEALSIETISVSMHFLNRYSSSSSAWGVSDVGMEAQTILVRLINQLPLALKKDAIEAAIVIQYQDDSYSVGVYRVFDEITETQAFFPFCGELISKLPDTTVCGYFAVRLLVRILNQVDAQDQNNILDALVKRSPDSEEEGFREYNKNLCTIFSSIQVIDASRREYILYYMAFLSEEGDLKLNEAVFNEKIRFLIKNEPDYKLTELLLNTILARLDRLHKLKKLPENSWISYLTEREIWKTLQQIENFEANDIPNILSMLMSRLDENSAEYIMPVLENIHEKQPLPDHLTECVLEKISFAFHSIDSYSKGLAHIASAKFHKTLITAVFGDFKYVNQKGLKPDVFGNFLNTVSDELKAAAFQELFILFEGNDFNVVETVFKIFSHMTLSTTQVQQILQSFVPKLHAIPRLSEGIPLSLKWCPITAFFLKVQTQLTNDQQVIIAEVILKRNRPETLIAFTNLGEPAFDKILQHVSTKHVEAALTALGAMSMTEKTALKTMTVLLPLLCVKHENHLLVYQALLNIVKQYPTLSTLLRIELHNYLPKITPETRLWLPLLLGQLPNANSLQELIIPERTVHTLPSMKHF